MQNHIKRHILGISLIAFTWNFIPGSRAWSAEAEPIRIQIGGEPSSLDPARIFDQYAIGIMRNVVEGLFVIDSHGKLQNGLVSSYKVSKDGLVYRFKIRSNAKWSDGKPVTLEDCIYGLKRTIDPKSASPEIDWYYSIKHVKEAYTGKKPISEVGITREGDDLVITLERPMPTLPFILSMPSAGPIRKDVIEANGGKWDYRHPSTGSYAISVYKPSSEVLLIPNPHARKPGLRPIQIRILQEEVTAMNLFEGGRLDIISSVIPSEADRLRKAGLLQTEPSSQVVYIAMNPTKAPLNDPTWRRAIAAQMDREGLSIAERKLFEPSTSFIPRTLDNGIKLAPIKADAEAVKIRAISPKPKIRLTYAESAVNKIIAEKIQNDLKKSLNLNITLEPMELKMLMSRLFNDPPEMYFLMKGALFDDPIAHLDAFTSIPGPNFARYQSEEYETLLAKVKTLAGGPKRTEAIRAANRLLVEKDVIIVPLLLRMQVFGVSKSLKNFQVSPFQVIDYGALTK